MTIHEINTNIQMVANANNYPGNIVNYGYNFHPICNIDQLRFFETERKQIIVDFSAKLLYLCIDYKVQTIAMPIKGKLFRIIVKLYNGNCNSGAFETPQVNRIKRLVNLCYSYAINSTSFFF